jgi:hypothetical protein
MLSADCSLFMNVWHYRSPLSKLQRKLHARGGTRSEEDARAVTVMTKRG